MKKVILILGFLALMACKKEETVIPDISQHKITYWVNSDSAFIRYNIGDDFHKHYVDGHFDTTFCVDGGSLVLVVTSWTYKMNCGVRIDGEVVFAESLTDFAQFEYYIP